MCIHETVQMTDEHRTIVCGDCGREFGHVGRDERETLVAYASEEHPVVVVGPNRDYGLAFEPDAEGTLHVQRIYPCARCVFAMSCGEDEGGCHS